MRELIFILPIFFLLIFQPAFAQDTDSQNRANQIIEQVINKTIDFIQVQINSSSWLDQQKKDELNKATESGLDARRTIASFLSDVRQFIVHIIFADSPIPFDSGIIFIVGFVIGTTLFFTLLWKSLKKFWKIAIPIVAVIAIILVSGIQLPTM